MVCKGQLFVIAVPPSPEGILTNQNLPKKCSQIPIPPSPAVIFVCIWDIFHIFNWENMGKKLTPHINHSDTEDNEDE